jgi:hypothetical protein
MTDQCIAPLAPSSSANTPTDPGEVFVPLSQIVEKGEEEMIVEIDALVSHGGVSSGS